MTFVDLEDVCDIEDAKLLADELMDEAIDASEATRKKSQKVRACQAKMKRLAKKCIRKKWHSIPKSMAKDMAMLEDCKAELSLDIWNI